MDEQLDKKIQILAQWLYECRYPVVFTGAGISTESGLPDFRGPDGVWTRRDRGLPPKAMSKSWDSVEPNSGHYAIVELQKLGKPYVLIGVGRWGFKWNGSERITRKAAWPDWRPPKEMLEREPDLPKIMPGGPDNPLGARALYLGNTLYRIHGTAQPWTIGTSVSSGCIRLTNENIIDLYKRAEVGAKVIVD